MEFTSCFYPPTALVGFKCWIYLISSKFERASTHTRRHQNTVGVCNLPVTILLLCKHNTHTSPVKRDNIFLLKSFAEGLSRITDKVARRGWIRAGLNPDATTLSDLLKPGPLEEKTHSRASITALQRNIGTMVVETDNGQVPLAEAMPQTVTAITNADVHQPDSQMNRLLTAFQGCRERYRQELCTYPKPSLIITHHFTNLEHISQNHA